MSRQYNRPVFFHRWEEQDTTTTATGKVRTFKCKHCPAIKLETWKIGRKSVDLSFRLNGIETEVPPECSTEREKATYSVVRNKPQPPLKFGDGVQLGNEGFLMETVEPPRLVRPNLPEQMEGAAYQDLLNGLRLLLWEIDQSRLKEQLPKTYHIAKNVVEAATVKTQGNLARQAIPVT